ncbi:sugar ABC transporter ATP-binding protein [Biomaibacter acetigenes]|uniref:Sugar ABC transporter ATP-binding protein n=1 Tax=Biomaibacter acetigenes TaxID=2316383 RepID=A0A3G2R3P2_9FIRM|nr:sugar ABC transporter ATP-binding protein [Biomaibacter acetigenes]
MNYFLEMKKITKSFNGNIVLKDVDLFVRKGEVHALVGENGAGKSTLMKILAGVMQPDTGEIFIDGKRQVLNNPKQAQDVGISMIFQDINLFPDLTVAENIFLQRIPLKRIGLLKLIDWKKIHKDTEKYLKYMGLNFKPQTSVKSLSVGEQKFVEIIRAMFQKAKIIIMDEPTTALTERETCQLFEVIRDVKKLGVTVIFISHRLDEVTKIADSLTILRDGKVVETGIAQNLDLNHIVKMMAGKEVEDRYPKLNVKLGKEVLKVENLGYNDRIKDISFSLRSGEILGITGLSGAGRRTLARTIFGINRPFEGKIFINDRVFRNMTPDLAIKNGLCYVTGIVAGEGLILKMAVPSNITLTNLNRVSHKGILINTEELKAARDFIKRLEIRAEETDIVQNLSGGSQKKLLFAKWLFANARIMMIEDPTTGIDISSKVDIYNIINELVRSGVAIILISSDLPELIGMCDRIMVMYNGEIKKEFSRSEATQEKLLFYASGGEDSKRTQTNINKK